MTPILAGWFVVHTYAVCPFRESTPSHYEIHVAAEPGGQPIALLTKDVAIYEFALSIEGSDEPVDIVWERRRREHGTEVEVVTGFHRSYPFREVINL